MLKIKKKLIAVLLTITAVFILPVGVYADYNDNNDVELEAAIQKVLSVVDDDMTDVEKALAVHDYIVLNCSYDTTLTKFDAYNCLVEKEAVCLGYSWGYKVVMDKLGVVS